MTYVEIGTHRIPLEKMQHLDIHEHESAITQRDYLNAIQHVRVDPEVRKALDQIDVHGEHRLDTWTVTGKGVYVGSWSKRLGKYIHKQHKIKMDTQALSIITERIGKGLGGTPERLDFVFSKKLWTAGEFGEAENSCWFPGRQYGHNATALLESDGGGAIKFYETNGLSRARCWFYNLDKSLLIFNTYDKQKKLEVLSIARLLSLHFGMDYMKHNDVIIDTTYINGHSIYAIGDPPISRAITLDFAYRAVRKLPVFPKEQEFYIPRNTQCFRCGMEGKKIRTHDGHMACEHCAKPCKECGEISMITDMLTTHDYMQICRSCKDSHHYSSCGECGKLYKVTEDGASTYACPACGEGFMCAHCEEHRYGDNRQLSNGDVICEGCYDEYYGTCSNCGEVIHNDDSHWIEEEDSLVCNDCYGNHYGTCSVCDRSFSDDRLSTVHDESICDSCAESRTHDCERCGELEWSNQSRGVYMSDDAEDEQIWCVSCTEEFATECPHCFNTYADAVHHECEFEEDEEPTEDDL